MGLVNVSSIGSFIREQREQARVSLRQLAQAAGVSNPYLSQIEQGLRKPSAELLQQIAKGLRISAEALYVQAGILDEPHGAGVVDAVLADPQLTERQKQMLIEVYESFRKEAVLAVADEQPAEVADDGDPDDGDPDDGDPEDDDPEDEGDPEDERPAQGADPGSPQLSARMVSSPAGNR